MNRIVVADGFLFLLCVSASPSTQPSTAEGQARVVEARNALETARKDCITRLPSNPQYKAAKRDVDAAVAKLAEAQRTGGADDVMQAATEKLNAQKALAEVAKQIEAADPFTKKAIATLAAANVELHRAKIAEAANREAKRRQEARDKQIADEVRRKQQQVDDENRRKITEARATEYLSVVNGEHLDYLSSGRGSFSLAGDEADLTVVAAKPQDFIGKPLIVTGGVAMADYYSYGYLNEKSTHYSLRFVPILNHGQAGDVVWLYQKRSMGDDVLKVVVKNNKDSGINMMFVRLKIAISSEYTHSDSDAGNGYEVLDWQFPEKGGKWTPWHSETGLQR